MCKTHRKREIFISIWSALHHDTVQNTQQVREKNLGIIIQSSEKIMQSPWPLLNDERWENIRLGYIWHFQQDSKTSRKSIFNYLFRGLASTNKK